MYELRKDQILADQASHPPRGLRPGSEQVVPRRPRLAGEARN
jgi:hypothetical protein